jgi:two-component system sensor kinase FixL
MNTAPRHDQARTSESLGHALRSSLDLPLSALRASLEALARELGPDERCASLDHALSEVSRAGEVVRDLADYATAPVPMPLACSIDEVVYSARLRLPREDRDRVACANLLRGRRLSIDGPLLSRAIGRLLRNAIEASDGPVLVAARHEPRDGGRTLVTVVNDAPAEIDGAWAEAPFRSTKPGRLGLGLTLAARDVRLLGGALTLRRTPRGEAVCVIDLPYVEVPRPTAEI